MNQEEIEETPPLRARDLFFFLFGREDSILRVLASKWSLAIGILLVWTAGIARHYDFHPLHIQHRWLWAPFLIVLVSSFLVYFCTYFGLISSAREKGSPGFFARYPSFLGAFLLTAPIAWIYAIPVEHFTGGDPLLSAKWNMAFLGIVSFWRVALIVRVIVVATWGPWWKCLFVVLLPACVEAFLGAMTTSLDIVGMMGGIELTPSDEFRQHALGVIAGTSFWIAFLLLILIWIPAGYSDIARQGFLYRSSARPRGAIIAAALSLFVWIGIALPFQLNPELRQPRVLMEYKNEVHRSRSLPHWRVPPTLLHAENFLEENREFEGKGLRPENYDALKQKIIATKDPDSKFGYIVFSIARHAEKLLDEEQGKKLVELIESRKQQETNWHDIRNIVRVHAVKAMWEYAGASEKWSEGESWALWERWTDLRLGYMFEEFVEKERFQRAVWGILTSEQKERLLSGEWDPYLKKETGHGRLYSAPKQVTRALGKPDHPEAFEAIANVWEKNWEPMLDEYLAASEFQRKREFSMDLADESFAVASWEEYADEFRKFVTMERDAIRELVQDGYHPGEELDEKIDNIQQDLREQMVEKYSEKAPSFMNLLEAE